MIENIISEEETRALSSKTSSTPALSALWPVASLSWKLVYGFWRDGQEDTFGLGGW